MLELLLIWLALAIVVGFIASARNRSGAAWLITALVLSPLIAAIALLLVGRGSNPAAPAMTAHTHRHCPECREVVRLDARRCKHCHCEITPITPPPG